MLGRFLLQDWLFLGSEYAAQLAAIAGAFLIWRGLRAAGLRINAFLLVAFILLVLSPLLIKPGGSMMLIPVFVPSLTLIVIPVLTPFAVAFFVYRGLAGAGLAPKQTVILALICGLLLLAVAAFQVAANMYVTSHHMLGSLANPHVG
jgi:hypothetical protein